MADEPFASVGAPVQAEADVAAAAFRNFAALLALHDRGICPPLPEYQHLTVFAEAFAHVPDEFSGETADHSVLAPLGDCVDDLDVRVRRVVEPFVKCDKPVPPDAAIVKRLKRRCSRSKNDIGTEYPRHHYRRLATIVSRCGGVLLVGRVVFLIHNN